MVVDKISPLRQGVVFEFDQKLTLHALSTLRKHLVCLQKTCPLSGAVCVFFPVQSQAWRDLGAPAIVFARKTSPTDQKLFPLVIYALGYHKVRRAKRGFVLVFFVHVGVLVF